MIMKKFGFASIATMAATGFAVAVFGLAAPSNADVDHQQWVSDIQQHATVGTVTSTVGNGR